MSAYGLEFTYIIKPIQQEFDHLRVCSLSMDLESKLLWAHYASGHRGFAIEVELPDEDKNIKKVTYNASGYYTVPTKIGSREAATEALTVKQDIWEYEREVRIISRQEYYDQIVVKSVTCGFLTPHAALNSMSTICSELGITLLHCHIGGNGIMEFKKEPSTRKRDDA